MVKQGAEVFLPVFEDSGYRYSFLSGQLDPRVAFDKERMLKMALELATLSPNVMVKVPGSAEGMWVLEELTARGIATNATLCFVVSQFVAVAEAVFTCPPKYISQLVKEADHIDFTARIWEDIPDQAMARLRQIPYFVKGYEEDGYLQAEFNTLEPLLSTYREFSAVTEKMVDFGRDRMALKEIVL